MLFDRVCHDNGIRHLLTAPYSPTTTGKIERLHKTMRREFFELHTFDTIEQAQAALDAWVAHYNTARPHQGIGDRPPADRFALAPQARVEVAEPAETSTPEPAPALGRPAGLPAITRRVADSGRISLAGVRYLATRRGPKHRHRQAAAGDRPSGQIHSGTRGLSDRPPPSAAPRSGRLPDRQATPKVAGQTTCLMWSGRLTLPGPPRT